MISYLTSINYHPPLTAFPFALICIVAILEILSLFSNSELFRKAIFVNLCATLLSVIAAFFSGYQADSLFITDDAELRSRIAFHHNIGRLLLFSVIACVAFYYASIRASYNKTFFSFAYYFLLFLCFCLVLYTGYLGGELVFIHGVGVRKPL